MVPLDDKMKKFIFHKIKSASSYDMATSGCVQFSLSGMGLLPDT